MNRLKIGLLMDTILHSDAGVQQAMKGLGRFLLSKGHDVKFIVPNSEDKGEFKGRIVSLGLEFNPFFNTTSVPLSLFASRREIREALEREQFDLIHAGIPDNPLFGGRVINHAECPVVVTFMSYLKDEFHRFGIEFMEKGFSQTYKVVDYCIAPSLAAKEHAEKVFPAEFNIIPFGIESRKDSLKSVEKLKKFDDGKFNLLFLGRLERRKGVIYLLQAYKHLRERNKNVRLILVGDGPRRFMLERYVGDEGLEDVVFEGYIDEELKAAYYASADLCVFPAIYGESFGIVLIEAMLAGRVPIVFGNPGYSWVMRDIPELIVPNRRKDLLTEKIAQLIKNPDMLIELKKRCVSKSREYKWDSVGPKILKVYEDVLVK